MTMWSHAAERAIRVLRGGKPKTAHRKLELGFVQLSVKLGGLRGLGAFAWARIVSGNLGKHETRLHHQYRRDDRDAIVPARPES